MPIVVCRQSREVLIHACLKKLFASVFVYFHPFFLSVTPKSVLQFQTYMGGGKGRMKPDLPDFLEDLF